MIKIHCDHNVCIRLYFLWKSPNLYLTVVSNVRIAIQLALEKFNVATPLNLAYSKIKLRYI